MNKQEKRFYLPKNGYTNLDVAPPKEKPKEGRLIWLYCGSETEIQKGSFALLQSTKKKLQKEMQYKNGTFKIVY